MPSTLGSGRRTRTNVGLPFSAREQKGRSVARRVQKGITGGRCCLRTRTLPACPRPTTKTRLSFLPSAMRTDPFPTKRPHVMFHAACCAALREPSTMKHPRLVSNEHSSAGQSNDDLGELAGLRVDLDRATMLLDDDVVTDGEPEPGSLSGRLR